MAFSEAPTLPRGLGRTAVVLCAAMVLEAYGSALAGDLLGATARPGVWLLWLPLWLAAGTVAAGPLSDRLGRKGVLAASLFLFALSALSLALPAAASSTRLSVLLAAPLLASAGAATTAALASAQEERPASRRPRTVLFGLGGLDLGSLALAWLGRSAGLSAFSPVIRLAAAALALVALAWCLAWVPESLRPESRGGAVAPAGAPGALSAAGAVVAAAVATVAFGLFAYVVGPYYFPDRSASVSLVAAWAAVLTWAAAVLWPAAAVGRGALLRSAGATLALTLAAVAAGSRIATVPGLFWALLVSTTVTATIAYLAAFHVGSAIWTDRHRGSGTALVRAGAVAAGVPVLLLTAAVDTQVYMVVNAALWGLGLIAALAVRPAPRDETDATAASGAAV